VTTFVAEFLRGDGPVRATGVATPGCESWIAGDVRLDGRDALRAALGAAGVATPDAASDADLVLAAWTAWRHAATERLRGDFTFVLWDHRERTAFCARDALGVRPLYWAEIGRVFVCSNVLDAVRAHPRVSSRLHEPAIVSFLQWGYNADTATTSFADIHRLPPGHQLLFRDAPGAIVPRRYWSFPVPEPLRLRRDEEYVERYHEVLGAAVRDRLRGGRAAILLSGGLDSTSLAATARRVAPGIALGAWTNDFSPIAAGDEVRLATSVATQLGIAHTVVHDPPAPLAHLDAPGHQTPEPLDEAEWAPWLRLLSRISADAPVLVIGEDGDALFRPPGLLTMLRSWPWGGVMRRVLSYTVSHRHHPHLGIWLRRRLAAPFTSRGDRPHPWIRRELLARGPMPAPERSAHPTRPDAARSLADSVWQSVLEPSQPAYTGVPLDIVWPLLDTRVIEFVFSIPPVPWCQRKELVRRAFRGDLPSEVLARKKTPLRGFYEFQVAQWRASRCRSTTAFAEAIHEFVDTRSVVHTLQTGPVEGVLAAWRVLALDRWLRGAEHVRTS
jgi:asparagine synthase (glutamine-hydrolysing)